MNNYRYYLVCPTNKLERMTHMMPLPFGNGIDILWKIRSNGSPCVQMNKCVELTGCKINSLWAQVDYAVFSTKAHKKGALQILCFICLAHIFHDGYISKHNGSSVTLMLVCYHESAILKSTQNSVG